MKSVISIGIKLANKLPWDRLAEIILIDLKKITLQHKWWLGRPLQLRTHLGVYLLQQLLNETDRGIEGQLRDNAAYQLFCGRTVVHKWRCPDHTKIEEFRSRLSPETQCALANEIAVYAEKFKFTNAKHIDIDSTIQEANIAYPSLPNLLIKLGSMAKKLASSLKEKVVDLRDKFVDVPLKFIKKKARDHFSIQRRNPNCNQAKTESLRQLWAIAAPSIVSVLHHSYRIETLSKHEISSRLRTVLERFQNKALVFIEENFHHIFEGENKHSNIHAFHVSDVLCFNKNKLNKRREYSRAYQVVRIDGNFLLVGKCASVRMSDPESLKPMIELHQRLFKSQTIESVATDKGYYSQDNERYLLDEGIKDVGLPRPRRKLARPPDNPITNEKAQELYCRRAGIEALIGHLKHSWQFGRSRMRTDASTESAGYCAVLGFNLRQITRYLMGEAKLNPNST